MTLPWHCLPSLGPAVFADVQRRAIFDCCKWDPQVEDVSVLCRFPWVLAASEWRKMSQWAESLASETLAAEDEVLERPGLHEQLGLPRSIRKLFRQIRTGGRPRSGSRVMRFDFHFTTDGWRISEANTDVPGGFIEASGFTRLMAAHYPGTALAGDPAARFADALAQSATEGDTVALVHATAYTDDRQVMIFLARQLQARGLRTCLVSPADLRWDGGRAAVANSECSGRVATAVRFFPGEWLPNLPRACGWTHWFVGGLTRTSNPGTALLSQSKRFPLVWDCLASPLPTWRALLPETRDPRQAAWQADEGWVLKPALGRVGESVGLRGVTAPNEWQQIARNVARWPEHWVAQRRFEPIPLVSDSGTFYPQAGVFTIDGQAAGVYGRLCGRPLINDKAQEVAVLVDRDNAPNDTREQSNDQRGNV